MKILKFGGSSLANAENIHKVIDIISESFKDEDGGVVVVSALGGVTDDLIKLVMLAYKKYDRCNILLKSIQIRHQQVVKDLTILKNKKEVLAKIDIKFDELERIVKKIISDKSPIEKVSLVYMDAVVSFGEQLSVCIVSEAIKSIGKPSMFVDARILIKTDNNFGEASVDIKNSYKLISESLKNKGKIFVMGGFIGSTKEGLTTTLGRGGSDYTASLVGAAIGASRIEIWTDVDGLMTADPKKVKDARSIPFISYKEAEKMAYLGAKVIHFKTMKPAQLKNIPIYIKNTFNPKYLGTKIS